MPVDSIKTTAEKTVIVLVRDKTSEKSYEKKFVLTDDDGGVVLKTTEPEVRGVIVVCDGGDNAAVKNGITSAVRAALSVDSNKITVLKMKNSEAK